MLMAKNEYNYVVVPSECSLKKSIRMRLRCSVRHCVKIINTSLVALFSVGHNEKVDTSSVGYRHFGQMLFLVEFYWVGSVRSGAIWSAGLLGRQDVLVDRKFLPTLVDIRLQ